MNIVQEIMKMVDQSLLSPSLIDEALKEGCEICSKAGVNLIKTSTGYNYN